jgi:hypothetical protein
MQEYRRRFSEGLRELNLDVSTEEFLINNRSLVPHRFHVGKVRFGPAASMTRRPTEEFLSAERAFTYSGLACHDRKIKKDCVDNTAYSYR